MAVAVSTAIYQKLLVDNDTSTSIIAAPTANQIRELSERIGPNDIRSIDSKVNVTAVGSTEVFQFNPTGSLLILTIHWVYTGVSGQYTVTINDLVGAGSVTALNAFAKPSLSLTAGSFSDGFNLLGAPPLVQSTPYYWNTGAPTIVGPLVYTPAANTYSGLFQVNVVRNGVNYYLVWDSGISATTTVYLTTQGFWRQI